MRNLETPVRKFAVYGATTSLGGALLHQLLARQHEVLALLDDLNAVAARPGLRAKLGDPCDAVSVGESVAGCEAVVYLHPRRPADQPQQLYAVVDGLLAGLPPVGLDRLLLVADFQALESDPAVEAALQRLALHSLRWTLVDLSPEGFDLSLDDFLDPAARHGRRQTLLREAAALADELEQPRNVHTRIRLRW